MKHRIIPPNPPFPYGSLILTVDDDERAEIKALLADNPDKPGIDLESEVLERLIANSELDWVCPSETHDLTDAPMLGIRGDQSRFADLPEDRHGETNVGGDEGGPWFAPITHRWAYMSYALRSFLTDLIDNGQTAFIGN